MASTYLSRTSGTSTNAQKYTMSFWVKRSALGAVNMIFYSGTGGTANGNVDFTVNDTFDIYERDASSVSWQLTTNRVFRDVGAWYHIVIEADSTQATSTDRVKIYVNGVQETSFGTSTYPNQNISFEINKSSEVRNIGKYTTPAPYYFDGLFTHFHFIDGTAYDADTFGETDATTGIWKPKTAPSVTYGTNGFFLKFEDSANMDLDSSPNNLTFSTSGTLTQTVDTPSNVFATGNPLIMNPSHLGTFSNGNNKLVSTAGGKQLLVSTLAVSSGKWYAEYKAENVGGGTMIGVIPYEVVVNTLRQNNYLGQDNGSVSMLNTSGAVYNPPTNSGITGVTYTSGDIIGIAMDLDNSYCYFHKNGTYINSGDPTSGATGTGGVPFIKGDSFWCFAGGDSTDAGGSIATISANFGNGYFGTTAVSSATSDESGLGIFEYTVPSGYYALCTKNINTQG